MTADVGLNVNVDGDPYFSMKTNSVILWGKNGGHLETKRNVVSVSAGDRHSLIATEKSIYVLGANDWGQLGLGHK